MDYSIHDVLETGFVEFLSSPEPGEEEQIMNEVENGNSQKSDRR